MAKRIFFAETNVGSRNPRVWDQKTIQLRQRLSFIFGVPQRGGHHVPSSSSSTKAQKKLTENAAGKGGNL